MVMKLNSMQLKTLVSIVILALMPGIAEGALWFDTDYQSAKKITINATEVIGGTHVNFPVLVQVTDSDLIGQFGGWDGLRDNPTDFVFTNINNNTKLDFEIQYFDSTIGSIAAWVRMDQLPTTGIEFMMYYNDTGSNGNQENIFGVWSDEYLAVYHMEHNSASPFNNVDDSTSNNHYAIRSGTGLWTQLGNTCQIGIRCLSFDGINDRVFGQNGTSLPGEFNMDTDPMSVSVWAYANITSTNNDILFGTRDGQGAGAEGFFYEHRHTANLPQFEWADNATQQVTHNPGVVNFQTGIWQYITNSYNANQDRSGLRISIDGLFESETPNPIPAGLFWSNTANLHIGAQTNIVNLWLGSIAEFRMRSDVPSDDWISTEYNNQRVPAPSNFMTISAQSSVPNGTLNTIILALNGPTTTRLGGVMAITCLPGQVLTGIDISGTPICEFYNTVEFMQSTSHIMADKQYWGFGQVSDNTNCNTRWNLIPFDMVINTITVQPRAWSVNGDTTFRLIKDGTIDTDVVVVIPASHPNSSPITNKTFAVQFLTGDRFCFQWDKLGNGGAGTLRGFSIGGFRTGN